MNKKKGLNVHRTYIKNIKIYEKKTEKKIRNEAVVDNYLTS